MFNKDLKKVAKHAVGQGRPCLSFFGTAHAQQGRKVVLEIQFKKVAGHGPSTCLEDTDWVSKSKVQGKCAAHAKTAKVPFGNPSRERA